MRNVLVRYFLLHFNPGRVNSVLAHTNLFFVVGMGRSGTVFLSRLLSRASRCSVYHETIRDRNALVDAYWYPDRAEGYLAGYRARLIAARILQDQSQVYGEVNSYLRFHVEALRALWNPRILHLVRDGRAVVRSLMNRVAFASADLDHTGRLGPRPDDPYANEWPQMNRFSRVCWYWAATNRSLTEHHLPIVRLEDIIGSYEAFDEQFLRPLGIHLAPGIWREQILKPQNVGKTSTFPAWEDWTDEQKCQFEAICGPVMSDLGYV